MLARRVAALSSLLFPLLLAAVSHAACTKDTDCKGERICEEGVCVEPAASLPPAPAAAPGTGAATPTNPAAATAPPVATAPQPAPEPPRTVVGPGEVSDAGDDRLLYDGPPPRKRHSTGMMVGGIVIVSFAPVALMVSMIASVGRGLCSAGGSGCHDNDEAIYGGLVAAAVFTGVGVPLIVIGARKEPDPDAMPSGRAVRIAPWATPQAAGVGLHVDL